MQFTILLVVFLLGNVIYGHGESKIFLFGEEHGPKANEFRQKSFEKYKQGKAEFLNESFPPGVITTPEEAVKVFPLMLETVNFFSTPVWTH